MASGLEAFKKGIGEIPGGKVHHRLQAVMGMYNFQALKGRGLQMLDAGEGDEERGL